MATYHAFPSHRAPAISPQALQAYALQQEQSRQADIKARADAAQAIYLQKAESEAAKLKAQREAEALKQAANFSLHQSRTNADMNLFKARQDAKNKPKDIILSTKVGDNTVTKHLSPEEYAAEKAASQVKELAKFTDERALLSPHWYNSDGKAAAELDGKINALKKDIELGRAAMPEQAAPQGAMQPPPQLIQQHPLSFNGATSWTGPGFAPVESKGFIGTPGGANSFVGNPLDVSKAPSPPITDAAPPDLLASQGFSPTLGDLRQAEAQQPPAPVAAQKIYDKNRGFVPMDAQGKAAPTPVQDIPGSHVKFLLENPDTAKHFNELYGDGASDQFLDSQP
jgi:hypothetical protein